MTWRYPGRQWRSRIVALGGAHMAGPLELNAPIIPYPGPPALWTYPLSSLSLSVGVPMSALVATVTRGAPYDWQAFNTALFPQALPAGVALDPSTGTMSGTPTTPMAMRSYAIGTKSKGGPAYVTLTITVT